MDELAGKNVAKAQVRRRLGLYSLGQKFGGAVRTLSNKWLESEEANKVPAEFFVIGQGTWRRHC